MLYKAAASSAALALVCLFMLSPGAPAQMDSSEQLSSPLTSEKTSNSEIFVHDITVTMEGGQTIDWSWTNNRLVVGRPGANQYYNIYSVSPEGYKLKNLTLAKEQGVARQHNGNASWHPSGEYFVFTSQNEGSTSYRMSLPGTGLNCNLWLGDRSGTEFYKMNLNAGAGGWYLTDVSETAYGYSVPVSVSNLLGNGNNLFEFDIGVRYTFFNDRSTKTDLSPVYPVINFGYRHQKQSGKGLIFRAFIGSSGIGIGIGKAFRMKPVKKDKR